MPKEEALAKLLLNILPPSMQKIRLEMRSAKPFDLTVPQFRVIGCIFRGKNLTSEIAEHQGVSLPAMSKMIDGLVRRKLIQRTSHSHDRRQTLLHLTKQGVSLYRRVRRHVQWKLSEKISALNLTEQIQLKQGLHQLEKLFLGIIFLILSLIRHAPLLSAGELLTWEICVQEAAQKNPDLNAAKETLRSAKYQSKGAYSGFLPQLSADINYNYGNNTSTAMLGTSSYSTSLSATENIFSGLQDKAKIQQGAANQEAAQANLDSVKAKVSLDLKSAFAGLRYAQNALKLTQEIIHRREGNLNLIQLRYENGRENKGSLLLSKAYLEQAKYDELQAKGAIRVAQEQLAKVLDWDDPHEIHIAGEIPTTSPPAIEDIRTLAALTPDYRQAVAQKKAAQATLTTARSPFFPTLNTTGTTGRQGNDWFPDNTHWSVTTSLSWPFFSGGKDYFDTKSAAANLAAAASNQESVSHQILTKLEQTLVNFVEAVQKLKTDKSFLEAATVREEIARNRYENGLLSFEDWDIIENDLITRQKQVLQSEKDRIISETTWEQTQGKGVFQ